MRHCHRCSRGDRLPISVRLFKGASAVLAGLGVYLLVGCAPTPPLNSGSHEPSTASVPIRAPYQTVSQEHHDRIRRLKRLVDARSDITMHTESVDPQEHGLSNYPVDIPVLRVVFDAKYFSMSMRRRSRIRRERSWISLQRTLSTSPPTWHCS